MVVQVTTIHLQISFQHPVLYPVNNISPFFPPDSNLCKPLSFLLLYEFDSSRYLLYWLSFLHLSLLNIYIFQCVVFGNVDLITNHLLRSAAVQWELLCWWFDLCWWLISPACYCLCGGGLGGPAPQVYFERLLCDPAEATFGPQMPMQKLLPLECNGKQILTFRENVLSEILKIFMWKRHLFNWVPTGNTFPLGCYVT